VAGRHRRQTLIFDCQTGGIAYSAVMKSAVGILCLGLALAACGQQPVRQAPKADEDPATSARALFDSNDWTLIGGKCVALLELPANTAQPENEPYHLRWRAWLEKSIQPELAAQMVSLNKQTYAQTPEPTLTAAAAFCRTKLDEIAPVSTIAP
jgi:hypothetical protein